MVPSGKQIAHKLPETKGGLIGPKRGSRPLLKQDSSCSNQQHSGRLHKQGRRHEVRLTVCPSVEDPDLVLQETGYSQSLTCSRPTMWQQTSYPG